MVIHKYELTGHRTNLDLPIGAQVLTAQLQGDHLVLWAIVDRSEQIKATRIFLSINTGAHFEIPGTLNYISTVQAGSIVWHVFEVL